jgi:sterol 3beta-glucosyltransferase
MAGALFLFRHRRSQVLDEKNVEASTGVRLSVPLHRIQDVQYWNAPLSSMSIVSLQVQLSSTDNNDFNSQEDGENRETQTLRLAQIMPNVQWSELGNYVAAAKARRESNGSEPGTSPLIVDFGPLTFSENDLKTPDSDAERAVSVALALGSETNIWSEFRPHHDDSILTRFNSRQVPNSAWIRLVRALCRHS